jgi:cell division protein FtsN
MKLAFIGLDSNVAKVKKKQKTKVLKEDVSLKNKLAFSFFMDLFSTV